MWPSSTWGVAQGKSAQVKLAAPPKRKDDDEVSLDFTGDEDMANAPMTVGDFQQNEVFLEQEVVDDFDIDVDGIIDSYWQVHFSPLMIATDDLQTELDKVSFCTNISSLFCCASKSQCECKNSEYQEWMLDSGALFHFSGDINNFVDYTQMERVPLKTANSSATIEGRGMIILVLSTGEKV